MNAFGMAGSSGFGSSTIGSENNDGFGGIGLIVTSSMLPGGRTAAATAAVAAESIAADDAVGVGVVATGVASTLRPGWLLSVRSSRSANRWVSSLSRLVSSAMRDSLPAAG